MSIIEILFSNLNRIHEILNADKKSRKYGALMHFNGFIPHIVYEPEQLTNFIFERKWRLYAIQVSPSGILNFIKRKLLSDTGDSSTYYHKMAKKLLVFRKDDAREAELAAFGSEDMDLLIDDLCRKENLKKYFCLGVEIRKESYQNLAAVNIFCGGRKGSRTNMEHIGFIHIENLLQEDCDFSIFARNTD